MLVRSLLDCSTLNGAVQWVTGDGAAAPSASGRVRGWLAECHVCCSHTLGVSLLWVHLLTQHTACVASASTLVVAAFQEGASWPSSWPWLTRG